MLEYALSEVEGREKEVSQLRAKVESLSAAVRKSTDKSVEGIPETFRVAIQAIAEDRASLEDVLLAVSAAYPDRVVVLDSALESARESSGFKHPRKAQDLVMKLVTSYWKARSEGQGDTTAREIFGDNYTARDSDKVENNATARKLRTFQYNGQGHVMFKHLKIGNKDSLAETLRIHFEWFPEEQKIVIGHCGRHLDHN